MRGLVVKSQAVQEWVDENVESEGWAWMGGVLWGEARYMNDIWMALESEGFDDSDYDFIQG